MGCDTRAYLKGHIEPEQVFSVIRELFDKNATMDKVTKTIYKPFHEIEFDFEPYDKNDTIWYSVYTRVDFTYNGEKRSIFVHYDNVNTFEGEDYYVEKDPRLYEMVHSVKTSLSFRAWGSSVEIMRRLVCVFGGWIDDNDCDDESFYYVEKDTSPDNIVVKPVRTVTMDEIYEMFGEVVKIVDNY